MGEYISDVKKKLVKCQKMTNRINNYLLPGKKSATFFHRDELEIFIKKLRVH